MPEEATLVTEADKPPAVSADFSAAKGAEETPLEPDPSIKIEEPPEKSASERLFDSIMELPEDERNAALSSVEKRLEEKGEAPPWKKRQEEEIAARTAVATQAEAQQRRQVELRSWESNRDAARANLDWLVNDFNDRWEKRELDGAAPRFDTQAFSREVESLQQASAGLLSHAAITEIGNAMNTGLEQHGGPITREELTAIANAISRADKVGAYMNALAARVKKEVSTDMEKDIEKRIKTAVDAEAGAIRAEVLRDVKVEPVVKSQGVASGGAPTIQEYADATSEQRREWQEKGVEPVLAE